MKKLVCASLLCLFQFCRFSFAMDSSVELTVSDKKVEYKTENKEILTIDTEGRLSFGKIKVDLITTPKPIEGKWLLSSKHHILIVDEYIAVTTQIYTIDGGGYQYMFIGNYETGETLLYVTGSGAGYRILRYQGKFIFIERDQIRSYDPRTKLFIWIYKYVGPLQRVFWNANEVLVYSVTKKVYLISLEGGSGEVLK